MRRTLALVGTVGFLLPAAISVGGCAGAGGGGGRGGGITNDNTVGNDNVDENDNTPSNENENDNTVPSEAILADHLASAEFDTLEPDSVESARHRYRIFYGHTSHGSQIITGMQMLAADDERYAFNAGEQTLEVHENGDVDLGTGGDLGWVDITREVLDTWDEDINMVMWSWCGGVSENTEEGIDAYLSAMDQLEQDYPGVVFVYMTGHLDGTGEDGNLCARNNQIRDYCRTHNKVLFDFADIESHDPDGNHYPDGSDACEWCVDWCDAHTCPAGCDDAAEQCAHSHCFNCYQKARAFWCMLARIAESRSG